MITNSSLSFGSLVSTVALRRRGCTGIHGVSLSGGEEGGGEEEGQKDSKTVTDLRDVRSSLPVSGILQLVIRDLIIALDGCDADGPTSGDLMTTALDYRCLICSRGRWGVLGEGRILLKCRSEKQVRAGEGKGEVYRMLLRRSIC